MSVTVTLRTGIVIDRQVILFTLPVLQRLLRDVPQVLREYMELCEKGDDATLTMGALNILRSYELIDHKWQPYDPQKQVALAYVEDRDGQMCIRTGAVKAVKS